MMRREKLPRDYEAHVKNLAQDHAALAEDLAALRAEFSGGGKTWNRASWAETSCQSFAGFARAGVTSAGKLAWRYPKAAAVVGGAAAVWAYWPRAGAKASGAEPDWLVVALAQQGQVSSLQSALRAAEQQGILLPEEAQLHARALNQALDEGLMALMRQGLDHLEPQARAAVVEARCGLYAARRSEKRTWGWVLWGAPLLAAAGLALWWRLRPRSQDPSP